MTTKLYVDVAYDTFIDIIGEDSFNLLKDGDDVTNVFEDDIAHPVNAKLIQVQGPGGGNPYVEMSFLDEDHAWEWFSESYGGEPDEFSLHLELAA